MRTFLHSQPSNLFIVAIVSGYSDKHARNCDREPSLVFLKKKERKEDQIKIELLLTFTLNILNEYHLGRMERKPEFF